MDTSFPQSELGDASNALIKQEFFEFLAVRWIVCAAVVFFLILKLSERAYRKQYFRASGEPPLQSGYFPILGVGSEYSKSPRSFISQCRKTHGDVFTLYIMGKRMTFVCDPQTISSIYRKSKLLIFKPITTDVMWNCFRITSAVLDSVDAEFHQLYHRFLLHGQGLAGLTTSFDREVQKRCRTHCQSRSTNYNELIVSGKKGNEKGDNTSFPSDDQHMSTRSLSSDEEADSSMSPWMHDADLYDFCCKIFFDASVVALFGQKQSLGSSKRENTDADDSATSQAERAKIFEAFKLFDDKFFMMLGGVPDFMVKGARQAQKTLVQFLDYLKPYSTGEDESSEAIGVQSVTDSDTIKKETARGVSPLIAEREFLMKRLGLKRSDISQLQLSLLWASQANTMAAAFWTLAYIVKNPGVLREVEREVSKRFGRSWTEKHEQVLKGSDEVQGHLPWTDLKVVNACVSEALRLTSAVFSVRAVESPQQLEIKSMNKSFHVRKGDTIMVDISSAHFDPNLYPEPVKFDHTRFLRSEMAPADSLPLRKKSSSDTSTNSKASGATDPDNGSSKQIFLPFGGGVSLCPGRNFARNEICSFVVNVLTNFEIELLAPMPPLTETRYGTGILPPSGKLPFRYRRKEACLFVASAPESNAIAPMGSPHAPQLSAVAA